MQLSQGSRVASGRRGVVRSHNAAVVRRQGPFKHFSVQQCVYGHITWKYDMQVVPRSLQDARGRGPLRLVRCFWSWEEAHRLFG